MRAGGGVGRVYVCAYHLYTPHKCIRTCMHVVRRTGCSRPASGGRGALAGAAAGCAPWRGAAAAAAAPPTARRAPGGGIRREHGATGGEYAGNMQRGIQTSCEGTCTRGGRLAASRAAGSCKPEFIQRPVRAEVQRCRGAEVQGRRGAEVQGRGARRAPPPAAMRRARFPPRGCPRVPG